MRYPVAACHGHSAGLQGAAAPAVTLSSASETGLVSDVTLTFDSAVLSVSSPQGFSLDPAGVHGGPFAGTAAVVSHGNVIVTFATVPANFDGWTVRAMSTAGMTFSNAGELNPSPQNAVIVGDGGGG